MKHHYVPAFYLRAFTDPSCPSGYEPYVWVVDLDDGTIRRRSPENTAVLTDYYAVAEGQDRQGVEKYLAAVESDAAPVIVKILEGASILDKQDKAALSTFAAVQIARVPGFRGRIEDFMTGVFRNLGALMLQDKAEYCRMIRESSPDREFTPVELDELYQEAIAAGPEVIEANPTAALGHALNIVPAIADLLFRMSWVIMAPSVSANFWTSDNPVYWINPGATHPVIGHGLAARGTEVNFPLGPRSCLLMNWSDVEGSFTITDLRSAQERGIAGAKRYLYCRTEADAEAALVAHRRMYPRRAVGPQKS